MSNLSRVWNEIRHGQNIDIYIGILLALVVALLGMIGNVGEEFVSAATLAVLAVVLGSVLGNRWTNEGIKEAIRLVPKPTYSADSFFREFGRHDLAPEIAQSKKVVLWSVTFTTTIGVLRYPLGGALRNGAEVCVLLICPDSSTAEVAAARNPGWDGSRISQKVRESVQLLEDYVAANPQGKLTVKYSRALPSWSMLAVYRPSAPARMAIRINTPALPGHPRPAFLLNSEDDPVSFAAFEAYFEDAWKSAMLANEPNVKSHGQM